MSALGLGASLIATPAASGASAPGAVGHAPRMKRADAERVARFWTPERIRRARPVQPTRSPRPDRLRTPLAAGANEHEVTDTTTYPAGTNGKLLFKDRHDLFECSGTVVDAPSERVVITAGHCVYSGGRNGRWSKKLIFIPGYRNGAEPFGVFAFSELWSTNKWVGRKNFSYDIGAAILSTNSQGQTVEEAAGARGIAFNQPREQSFQAFGYPAARGFDGEALWECDAPFAGDDPRSDPGPPALRIRCNLPAGASGGGWIIGGQYLNSVTSYGYSNPHKVYGPYFGGAAEKLFNAVSG